MQIIAANTVARDIFANEIPDLVWATGPVSYDYHFSDRDLFDAIVLGSWHLDKTLFAADAATLAVEGGELMGIEIGMPGSEYISRQNALSAIWQDLIAKDQFEADDIAGVLERSEHASWLNPFIRSDAYYIHAISVKPNCQGKRVGYQLMENSVQTAREKGFVSLQLDVLSDNPAVEFYRAFGFELLAETRAPKPSAFGIPPEYRMGMKL